MDRISLLQYELPALIDFFATRKGDETVISVDFLNIHGYSLMLSDASFAEVQSDVDFFVRDGVGLKIIGKYLAIDELGTRVPGPVFFEFFLKSSMGRRHLFLGGSSDSHKILAARYGKRENFAVVPAPVLRLSDDSIPEFGDKVSGLIADFGPEFIWIGLGCPKQNFMAAEIKRRVRTGIIFCVGAAFDFHAGSIPAAPQFVRIAGVESIWRLFFNPKKIGYRLLSSMKILFIHMCCRKW